MNTTTPSATTSSPSTRAGRGQSRRTGWSGLAFVVLLLLSAGMASVPGGSDSVATVRAFYLDHAPVVVVAQLIGLAAAAVFALHSRALAGVLSSSVTTWLRRAGFLVAASAGLTALPVLVLTAVVASAPDRAIAGLARASDVTDVVLFASVSLFAAVAARASGLSWVGVLAGTVALLTLARSVLLACGSSALVLVAPLAFISLVAVLSIRQLRLVRVER